MADRRDTEGEEGRRVVARATRDSEGILGGSIGRVTRHFSGADADPSDKAELWGRRVGRALSLIGVIVLAYLLFKQLAQR